jgi:CheY-like chemotaxis protein
VVHGEALPTVLVVDDDDDFRFMLDTVLTASKRWRVVCAASGDAAVDIARRECPVLILLDRRMPNGDGLTTFLKLREDARTHTTPVILVSAFVGDRVPEGFAGVIRKPVDPTRLVQQVDAILADPC